MSCLTFYSVTETQRASYISVPWTRGFSQLYCVYNINWKGCMCVLCVCVCVCVCTVMVLGNLNWNSATWSYNVHLDNCFFVNIVSCKILARCYGSNDINRNNSGATNLRGFFLMERKILKLKIHFLFATMGIQTPEKHKRTL